MATPINSMSLRSEEMDFGERTSNEKLFEFNFQIVAAFASNKWFIENSKLHQQLSKMVESVQTYIDLKNEQFVDLSNRQKESELIDLAQKSSDLTYRQKLQELLIQSLNSNDFQKANLINSILTNNNHLSLGFLSNQDTEHRQMSMSTPNKGTNLLSQYSAASALIGSSNNTQSKSSFGLTTKQIFNQQSTDSKLTPNKLNKMNNTSTLLGSSSSSSFSLSTNSRMLNKNAASSFNKNPYISNQMSIHSNLNAQSIAHLNQQQQSAGCLISTNEDHSLQQQKQHKMTMSDDPFCADYPSIKNQINTNLSSSTNNTAMNSNVSNNNPNNCAYDDMRSSSPLIDVESMENISQITNQMSNSAVTANDQMSQQQQQQCHFASSNSYNSASLSANGFKRLSKQILMNTKAPIRHLICSPGLELKAHRANLIVLYKGHCNGNCYQNKPWSNEEHLHYIVNTINCNDHVSRLVRKQGFKFYNSFLVENKDRQTYLIGLYKMEKVYKN
jgi:hypothetical protein